MKEMASIVNTMPSDNVPYFLTLIRFHYATFTNTKRNNYESLHLFTCIKTCRTYGLLC